MKKFRVFAAFGAALICMAFAKISAYAKPGDVIGKVYSTDIIAKIDNLNAPSYCIDGKTAIILEELADNDLNLNYAIKVKYDDDARRLDVTMESSKGCWGKEYEEIKRGTPGKIVGEVYETDIKVVFNGYEIEGMNIGGRTAVAIEDLGLVGGINEEFGYSKYRCKATWKADERIIALDFIDKESSFSVYNYGHSLKYSFNDNILTAEFDRMANYVSEISEFVVSEEFKNDANVLKPLYFDDGTTKTEIGFTYVEHDTVDDSFLQKYYITDSEFFKEFTDNISDGTKPVLEEALKVLDDKINYAVLDTFETEDFYVLTVELLQVEDHNDVAFVLLKKMGGYGKIYGGSTSYSEMKIEKTGKNVIKIGYPTADPHGKTAMLYCEFNLNNYFVK